MNSQETERIDRITEVVHYLLKGRTPDPIPCENDPDDEIRQLSEKVNELNRNFREIKAFIIPISEGNLKVRLPKRNILASPFKQLHASLSHLTWQTRQIARGDFNQRVDFMGDFSQSFNAMVEALDDARSQLMSETEQFKQLADIKRHYLNVMAHDIRTPIGAVIGFTDILLQGNLGGEEKKQVRIIKRNCDSLLVLINNILDMAKLEKRKMELVSVPLSVRTLGQDVEAMIQPKLNQQTRFIFDTDERIPEKLMGDPHRLQQVLVNLVGNAAKFTNKGTITLRIKLQEQHSENFKLHFSIEDTGIGISQDKLTDIFTPFSQADSTIASRFGGTGLGLAISRELVSLMGGHLQVKSQPDRGTTFYFSLLFGIAEETESEPPTASETCSGTCNILVVDDDPHVLKIIENLLTKQDVRFTLCQDSTNAYDLLIRAYEEKNPFTLAWLDIDMPKLNGFQLAAKIREDHRLSQLHLIACTSHIEKVTDSDSPSYFSFVATKPISAEALRRILDEAKSGYAPADHMCDLFGIRLLVADDNLLNRFLVTNMLQKLNIEVTEAENGLEAVNKVLKNKFDVVLMDKMMPVMDGTEAVRRIRETYDKDALPIFAFTADDSSKDKARFLSAGANGFISKPIVYEDIVESLCQLTEFKYLLKE
ncbi:response regulator [Desulfonema magnum]|uniref:histidine kinase n=1 Tax=Desulfonema magnum TaxID=45655 RepID=A0A975BTX0_9BACT|nr:response regulator [Desulfonema magnum]QTA91654.1 Two component system response regulator/histidine kinase, HAMP domain-containing [Desulfonema magnum]